MKIKALSILTALALVLTAPLMLTAQEPNEQNLDQSAQTELQEPDQELDVDAGIETETEVEADGEIDTDHELDMDAQTELDDDEFEAEDDSLAFDDDEDTLPQTASPLALIALLGAASVGSAAGVRNLRRR